MSPALGWMIWLYISFAVVMIPPLVCFLMYSSVCALSTLTIIDGIGFMYVVKLMFRRYGTLPLTCLLVDYIHRWESLPSFREWVRRAAVVLAFAVHSRRFMFLET